MMLRDAIDHYVVWRRAHGARFLSSAHTLYQFCKAVPAQVHCDAVTESEVRQFLAGTGPLTRCARASMALLPDFTAMRSAVVTPPDRHCRPQMKNREIRHRRRLTYTRVRNCGGCLGPLISAAGMPTGSTARPSEYFC